MNIYSKLKELEIARIKIIVFKNQILYSDFIQISNPNDIEYFILKYNLKSFRGKFKLSGSRMWALVGVKYKQIDDKDNEFVQYKIQDFIRFINSINPGIKNKNQREYEYSRKT